MLLDDIRKTLEATFSNLSPSKAQELAKGLMEPGAAKDQIAKTAAELIEWSQGNRERLTSYIREEIQNQMKTMGVATRSDLDSVKKRVRDLERAAGMTASGRSGAKKATTRKRSTAKKKSTARKSPATKSTATKSTATTPPAAPASPASTTGTSTDG
jgi:polyhydroxyalkanoate synthesis regulator phasin